MSFPIPPLFVEGMAVLAQAQGGRMGVAPRTTTGGTMGGGGGFSTGGTLEQGFAGFLSQYEAPFEAAGRDVIASGLRWMVELSEPALILLIVGCGMLGYFGQFHMGRLVKYGWRVLLMLALLGGAYWDWIAVPFLEDIPNEIGARVQGAGGALRAVEQFDIVSTTIKEIANVAWANASGLSSMGDRVVIWTASAVARLLLGGMFFVWACMRILLHLVVMVGAFTIVFIPFDTTLSFFRQFMGKLVGLTFWQIGAAVTIKILITGTMLMLDRVTQAQASSLPAQINLLVDIAVWNLGTFLVFLVVPAATGIGSAIAATATAMQSLGVAAATGVASLGMRAGIMATGATGRMLGR